MSDELSTELWELGTLGVIEDAATVTAFFIDQIDLTNFAARFSADLSSYLPDLCEITHYLPPGEPVFAGDRFLITATSDSSATPPGRFRLNIDASSAFGSGRHETTQLVLAALEICLGTASLMLDVGSGSGIISAAALALGINTVIACDIDDLSLQLTRRSAAAAHLYKGSVDALASASVSLMVANISASVIDLLSLDLVRISKPGATLILSGFVGERTPTTVSPERVLQLNDWLCWICRPESIRLPNTSQQNSVQPFAAMWW